MILSSSLGFDLNNASSLISKSKECFENYVARKFRPKILGFEQKL